MRDRIYLFYFILIFSLPCFGQAPVISSIQPTSAGPKQQIGITGSGFSATTSQLNVWFDHVKGSIVSSSNFSIQVQVPPQARYSNIEVQNLSNGLSAKSSAKFLPSFGGGSFDETKLSNAFSSLDATELFDLAGSDLDLDGKPDFAVSKTNNGTPATDMLIFQNKSTGIGNVNFTKVDKSTLAVLNVGSPTYYVTCGDLNGDGKPEIMAARTGGTNNQIFILKNTNSTAGTLSFASAISIFIDPAQVASRINIRDLNGDGKPELIVSNSFDNGSDNQIYIFPNQSSGGTISFGSFIKLVVTGASSSYGLEVQDMDGDALPDIVLNQFQTNNFFVFKNQSSGNISFSAAQKITVTGSFNSVTSADLNNDGLLDLIFTATLNNNIQIWLNQSTAGNIAFAQSQTLTTALGPWGVEASDIDGDGDIDIIVANRNEAKLNVFRQEGSLTFTTLTIATARPSKNIRVGDYDGDGKPDIAFTTFSATQYSLEVIRNANCVSPLIKSPSPTICPGQTIRLETKPALGVTFDWKKDGVSVQTSALEYFDATAAGTYTVTAAGTVDTGCSITSPNFVLANGTGSAPANPPVNFNSACIGAVLNLSTTAVSGATYKWTGPNSFTSASQNPAISPVTNLSAGIYSLQVTVGVCSSPVISKQVDVSSVPVLPVTSSPGATACVGGSITLSVSGSGYTYQWNKGGTPIGGQTGASLVLSSLSAASEADYSVVVTSIATSCSQETAKTSVKVYSVPVANFSFSSPQCTGTPVSFTDQSTADARGTLSYAWTFGDGNTSSSQNPTNTYITANSYSPNLTVSYSGISGCSNSISKPITINSSVVPSIQSTADPICVGDATTLSIAGTFNLIAWSGDNALSGSSSSVGITKPGNYSVNTTDENGCTASASIVINPKPIITPFSVTVDKPAIKLGDHVQLTATSGADSYSWTPVLNISDPTISNPTASPTLNTYYKVVAKKVGFCDASDSVMVSVDTGGGANINPPILFTPNGDTFNDVWKIPDTDSYPDCTMTVYDGHGSQMYQQKPYNSSNYWDGTYNGKLVPEGTYFYVFSCPTLKPATGTVLVVR